VNGNPKPRCKLTELDEIPEEGEVVEVSKCFTKGKVEAMVGRSNLPVATIPNRSRIAKTRQCLV